MIWGVLLYGVEFEWTHGISATPTRSSYSLCKLRICLGSGALEKPESIKSPVRYWSLLLWRTAPHRRHRNMVESSLQFVVRPKVQLGREPRLPHESNKVIY
jgi:hypothetical protein